MKFKFYDYTENWFQVLLKNSSARFSTENEGFKLKGFECRGIHIGPSSRTCGCMYASIPSFSHSGGTMAIENFVTMSIDTVGAATNILSVTQNISSLLSTSSSSLELPFPINVTGIQIAVAETNSEVMMLGISGSGTNLLFYNIEARVENKAYIELDEVALCFCLLQLEVASMKSLTISEVAMLSKPLLQIKMTFNDALRVSFPSPLHIKLLQSSSTSSSSFTVDPIQSMGTNYIVPFPIHIHMNKLNVGNMGRGMNLSVDCIKVDIEPSIFMGQDLLDDTEATNGAHLTFSSGNILSELFQVCAVDASCSIRFHDIATLNDIKLILNSVKVTAGFSDIDWASFFKKKTTDVTAALNTPYAHIDPFQLSMSYKGKVLSTRSNILVPAFIGDASTTSNQIIAYYTDAVLKRTPGLITNSEFLGDNIVDCTLKNTGMQVVGKATRTVAGAGMGSVAGLVAADAIRAAVDSGKKARNADSSDGYKFGDLTRGTIYNVKEHAKSGAKMRGDPDTYVPGDLTAGSIKAASEYMGNNKSKLGGAAGSGVGAMVGLAVAGPLGFVAGSYLGSKAGQDLVDDGKQMPRKADQPLISTRETPKPFPTQPPSAGVRHETDKNKSNNNKSNKDGYKFGDITKSIVARGKQASGRKEDSGYKFGDFTRGLFK